MSRTSSSRRKHSSKHDRSHRSGRVPWLAALLVAGLIVAGSAQPAAAGTAREFGRGMAVIGTNIFYMPAKLLYATGGAMVAGVAWVFSGGNGDVAGPIADASLRGDYVVSLSHLDRTDRLEFIGRSDAQRRAEQQAGWGDEQVSSWGSPQETEEGF